MKYFWHILLACFIIFSGAISFAEDDNLKFDIIKFKSVAERADRVLESTAETVETLEALRATLHDYGFRALLEQESNKRHVVTLRKQLDIIGTKPKGSLNQEDITISTRRAELTKELSEVQGPLIVAEEAYFRAKKLVDDIDEAIRKRRSNTFLGRSSSPISPKNWLTAFSAVKNHATMLWDEVVFSFQNPKKISLRLNNLFEIITLIMVGLVLIFPVTMLISYKFHRNSNYKNLQRSAVTFVVLSLGLLVVPTLGFFLLLAGIKTADIFLLLGNNLINYLSYMYLPLLIGFWIIQNLFHHDGAAAVRIFGKDQNRLLRVRYIIIGLSFLFSVKFLITSTVHTENWSSEITASLQFPLIILGALGLFLLIKQFQNDRIQDLNQSISSANPLTGGITTIIYWFCFCIVFVGPLAGVVGYVNLGEGLVFSTLLSLALFCILYLIYHILLNILGAFIKTSNVDLQNNKAEGLYKAAVVSVLICLLLPFLAIIWGSRVSDISDIWFRLKEGVVIGDARFSLFDLFYSILIFSIGYTITRVLKSALKTSVLPHTHIEEGVQNALITGFGYIGIFLAVLFAVMSTGLDLSNLAIVAGALSVGIGFGLQTIVSNFVSGIILLIERPIKIGDWVEVDGFSGHVSSISVRSTRIETFDKATVIVPNADLIGGSVKNLTHQNTHGRMIIPIGVAYGTDPELVKKILLELAGEHSMILRDPAPYVLFRNFGSDALEFELRAILRDVGRGITVRSDLNYKIAESFTKANIEIPFSQREITIKNPEILQKIKQRTKSK